MSVGCQLIAFATKVSPAAPSAPPRPTHATFSCTPASLTMRQASLDGFVRRPASGAVRHRNLNVEEIGPAPADDTPAPETELCDESEKPVQSRPSAEQLAALATINLTVLPTLSTRATNLVALRAQSAASTVCPTPSRLPTLSPMRLAGLTSGRRFRSALIAA